MSTEKKLAKLLYSSSDTMASHYERLKEILDYVEEYFRINIDETAKLNIEEMTINELRSVLEPKIKHYSNFVATSKPGVFREVDKLEVWLKDGAKK